MENVHNVSLNVSITIRGRKIDLGWVDLACNDATDLDQVLTALDPYLSPEGAEQAAAIRQEMGGAQGADQAQQSDQQQPQQPQGRMTVNQAGSTGPAPPTRQGRTPPQSTPAVAPRRPGR